MPERMPRRDQATDVPPELRKRLIAYTRDVHNGSRPKAFMALGISQDSYDNIISPNGRVERRTIEKVIKLLDAK